MPSTTPCALHSTDDCNNKQVRLYKLGTKDVPLCTQCSMKTGVALVVQACVDGGDVETAFRDIMTLLAKKRQP